MKSYREAVKNLARPQQMTAVQAELDHMLSTPLDDTLPEPLEEFTDLPQVGSEVTGPYSTLSAEELLTTLGMPGKQIVGMTTERDSARVFNKWETTMESQAFWDHPPPGRLEATTLSWHQVVGVHAATRQMAQEEPCFLFDGVGIGKTAQGVGVILMRPWLRKYYQTHHNLPPAFGECKSRFCLWWKLRPRFVPGRVMLCYVMLCCCVMSFGRASRR